MTKPSKNSEGVAFAHIFSAGSRALKKVPPLNWLLVGNNNVPDGWRFIGTVTDGYPKGLTFPADEAATRLPIPRLYKTVGVMAVETARMQELRDRFPVHRHAVGIFFSRAIVVGALAEHMDFCPGLEPAKELVGLRLGPQPVRALPGLWLPDTNSFVPAATAECYSVSTCEAVSPLVPIA